MDIGVVGDLEALAPMALEARLLLDFIPRLDVAVLAAWGIGSRIDLGAVGVGPRVALEAAQLVHRDISERLKAPVVLAVPGALALARRMEAGGEGLSWVLLRRVGLSQHRLKVMDRLRRNWLP
jgi:hypothetical protein